MNSIGKIIHGDSIAGIKSLFMNAYIHNVKVFNFYKKIEDKEKRLNLVTNIASDLSKKCKFLLYIDSESSNVIYSIIAYTLIDGNLKIYFAYTKYSFRGYGFCKLLLEHLEKESKVLSHCVPKKLERYSLWSKYVQTSPYYPVVSRKS